MKKIDVSMIELTKEEAANLTEGQILVYNPITDRILIEEASDKRNLAKRKQSLSCLVYLSIDFNLLSN